MINKHFQRSGGPARLESEGRKKRGRNPGKKRKRKNASPLYYVEKDILFLYLESRRLH